MLLDAIGLGLFMLGLSMDILNLRWAYVSARENYHKSGLIVVPAVLYIAGVFVFRLELSVIAKLAIAGTGALFHVFSYFVAGTLFDKVLSGQRLPQRNLPSNGLSGKLEDSTSDSQKGSSFRQPE